MNMIYPSKGEMKFGPRIRYLGKRYELPQDINWMTAHIGQEGPGTGQKWFLFFFALILAIPTFGFAILLSWIAYRVSKKDTATVELMTTNGTYFRGFTTIKREVDFAKLHEVADLPEGVHAARREAASLHSIK